MQLMEMKLVSYFADCGKHDANGVEVDYWEDGTVHICCDVPGLVIENKERTVELFSEHTSLVDFIYEFINTHISDLQAITPEQMLKRFLVGRASLYFAFDDDLEMTLTFRWEKGKLIAIDGGENNRHEVPTSIQTAEQMLTYTEYWFEKYLANL
jgi:hypothetical protein